MKTMLITGFKGEIGSQMLKELVKKNSNNQIIALDIAEKNQNHTFKNVEFIQDSITNIDLLQSIFEKHDIDEIYHFVALLSQSSKKNPELAQKINVDSTIAIIDLAYDLGLKKKKFTKFFFPSSIAVYGPRKIALASEKDIIKPKSLYGLNKISIEQYGTKKHEQSILNCSGVDFRSLRFPGILSPYNIPTGGTTDYLPQMLHSAKNGLNYVCQVDKKTTLPFITIDNAIRAITQIMSAKSIKSKLRSFNVQDFSISAYNFELILREMFSEFQIQYKSNQDMQNIADSWPESLNCELAISFGFSPDREIKKIINNLINLIDV
jgi:threonine 3-dehydrogenase